MVNSNLLPPPPVRDPVTDKTGKISPIWMTWFTQLFNRLGRAISLSNEDLAILSAYSDTGEKQPERRDDLIYPDQSPPRNSQKVDNLDINVAMQQDRPIVTKQIKSLETSVAMESSTPNLLKKIKSLEIFAAYDG